MMIMTIKIWTLRGSLRYLKRVLRLNWVHGTVLVSQTELTTSLIECLSKDWTSPIYVFFRKLPQIEYVNNHCVHVFGCATEKCWGKNGRDICWFLDIGDAKSMNGLRRHAKNCWGEEAVEVADGTQDLESARKVLVKTKLRDGWITAEFEHIGRGKVSYLHHQHTSTESR